MIPLVAVLTTIQAPTASVTDLLEALRTIDARLIVIGDKKGPSQFQGGLADFFPLAEQSKLPYRLAHLLPTGHYSRKNLGYLIAFDRGARCIYETDDDNAPLPSWVPRMESIKAQRVVARPWMNVYRLFKNELIWPRGFPLDKVGDLETFRHDGSAALENVVAPIQQGLANNSPDVDAVWRLALDRPMDFDPGPSVWLPPDTYCPFNSQTTWWWPDAYPLMYLPSYCSFRMTDIWRSFIAQRCLWACGSGVAFHGAEVVQQRNEHNLLRDFEDEIPGYLHNEHIVRVLNKCNLGPGIENAAGNLHRCYQALVEVTIFPPEEMPLLEAWLDDIAAVAKT